MSDTPIGMFVAVGVIVLLTLAWMAVQVYFLYRLTRTEGEMAKGPLVLWLVSAGGMFTGPCVALFSLVALVVSLVGARKPDASPKDRLAYRAVMVTSCLGLGMVVVALVGAAASGAFAS